MKATGIYEDGWKWLSKKKVLSNYFLKSLQKQPYGDVLQNRWSWKCRKIHSKTSVLAYRPATLFKRDFNTGVFFWILWNFHEQLFLQNASRGCFCQFYKVTVQSFKKVRVICFIESPLKMMKNALFHFKSSFRFSFFVSTKFLSRVFGLAGKTAWLER